MEAMTKAKADSGRLIAKPTPAISEALAAGDKKNTQSGY